MTNRNDGLDAAVTAGAVGSEETFRELLQSIVETARAVFGAKASSIMRHDEASDELVFEAVAGEGAGTLVGVRIPARTGIAGWVLASGEAISVADVVSDPRFARDVAERTGFIPTTLTSFPLLHDERALGVFNVLDRAPGVQVGLAEMEILGRFAHQAAITLAIAGAGRRTRALLEGGTGESTIVARLAHGLSTLEGPRRDAAVQLLRSLAVLLGLPD